MADGMGIAAQVNPPNLQQGLQNYASMLGIQLTAISVDFWFITSSC